MNLLIEHQAEDYSKERGPIRALALPSGIHTNGEQSTLHPIGQDPSL